MISLKQRVTDMSKGLKQASDSDVIHLQTLRKAIGYVALSLPVTLVLGENLRDWLLSHSSDAGRVLIEGSISAYFHTGMREVFVGSLCGIAVFLVCYKGYDRRDIIAARVAGISVFLVALFPTRERSREAGDSGQPVVDSATLFSTANAADPAYVGVVHFVFAAVFFITLAVMSIQLFTLSDVPEPTPEKRQRNRVYVVSGWTILICIALIAITKLFLGDSWNQRTSLIFWLETIAVIAFAISWLTKAEVILGDQVPAARARKN
ncbi:MAG: DUF998 domain-containing protein [Anaerolineae bacterium]|nr:DUF998 domain-containing protein [Gemmatimonadaceae bacterium]